MAQSIRLNYLFVTGGLTLTLLLMSPLSSKAVTQQDVNDFNHTPFYTDKTFSAPHQDVQKSYFLPCDMPSGNKTRWSVLQRKNSDFMGGRQATATFFEPSQNIEGGLSQNDSRGKGFSALHKIDPLIGENLAAFPAWHGDCLTVLDCAEEDPSTLDVFAASQTPLVDIDGNVYIGDLDQFWSFDKDLNVRWVVSLADIYEGSFLPFISTFLTNDGLVGGISSDCRIALFYCDTGELAVPVFEDTNCQYMDPKDLSLSFLWYMDGKVNFPLSPGHTKGPLRWGCGKHEHSGGESHTLYLGSGRSNNLRCLIYGTGCVPGSAFILRCLTYGTECVLRFRIYSTLSHLRNRMCAPVPHSMVSTATTLPDSI